MKGARNAFFAVKPLLPSTRIAGPFYKFNINDYQAHNAWVVSESCFQHQKYVALS